MIGRRSFPWMDMAAGSNRRGWQDLSSPSWSASCVTHTGSTGSKVRYPRETTTR